MTKIVFLLGEAGVGKDLVAQEFVDNGFTRVSFADALKEEYAKEAGIDSSILHVQGKEKEKHRKKLITFAEAARAKDPLVWLNKAFEPYIDPVTRAFKDDVSLVISDHRRDAEVQWYYNIWKEVEARKAQSRNPEKHIKLSLSLFHVVRPDVIDLDTLTAKAIGTVYGIDLANPGFISAVINNDSTKDMLKEKLKKLMITFKFNI